MKPILALKSKSYKLDGNNNNWWNSCSRHLCNYCRNCPAKKALNFFIFSASEEAIEIAPKAVICPLLLEVLFLRCAKIILPQNEFFDFPPPLLECGQLQQLSFHLNPMREIPADLYCLTHLTELDISATAIRDLPDTMGQCDALEKLDIEENRLIRLPASTLIFAKLTVFGSPISRYY